MHKLFPAVRVLDLSEGLNFPEVHTYEWGLLAGFDAKRAQLLQNCDCGAKQLPKQEAMPSAPSAVWIKIVGITLSGKHSFLFW